MSDAKLNVVLGAKTAEFNKALKSASARFSKFGKQLQRTGRNLTRNLTIPLSLAGGASVKMSLDFQKSMTRIQTLVGKSTEEIEVMSEKLLQRAQRVVWETWSHCQLLLLQLKMLLEKKQFQQVRHLTNLESWFELVCLTVKSFLKS